MRVGCWRGATRNTKRERPASTYTQRPKRREIENSSNFLSNLKSRARSLAYAHICAQTTQKSAGMRRGRQTFSPSSRCLSQACALSYIFIHPLKRVKEREWKRAERKKKIRQTHDISSLIRIPGGAHIPQLSLRFMD